MSDRDVTHQWIEQHTAADKDHHLCAVCGICTCHSPELSARPCRYRAGADHE